MQLKLNCCYETVGEAEEESREEEERDAEGKRGRGGGENLEIAKDKRQNFQTVDRLHYPAHYASDVSELVMSKTLV